MLMRSLREWRHCRYRKSHCISVPYACIHRWYNRFRLLVLIEDYRPVDPHVTISLSSAQYWNSPRTKYMYQRCSNSFSQQAMTIKHRSQILLGKRSSRTSIDMLAFLSNTHMTTFVVQFATKGKTKTQNQYHNIYYFLLLMSLTEKGTLGN